MVKKRLNLTLDPEVYERARAYADLHRTSISRLVESFLSTLPDDSLDPASGHTPTVRRLHGVALGGPDRESWRRHLIEKHGG